ncbi:MAG: OmpA family protein, partial [Gammaproteobacteria bacterium]|nr:OmpA family protein [Gammaproteobacteria bacterium]
MKPVGTIETNQELHLPADEKYTQWEMTDVEQIEDKIEKKNVLEQVVTTKKLKDVVPPIQFKSGKADIPDHYIGLLRDVLQKMKNHHNVRLHFVGHSDNVKLSGRSKKKYKDNLGLSRERAGTTAEFFQRALRLPPEAISYDGMGERQPVADNKTAAGRAKNRRVEVQVWYDEINEKIVEKDIVITGEMRRIKVCRIETVCKIRYKEGHKNRAKIKNLIPALQYNENVSAAPDHFLRQISQAMANLKGKENITVKLIGYTDNIALAGREERIYGDHIGLSKARARRLALSVQEALNLPNRAITSDGRGSASPMASNESEKGRALNRRIEVEFWYDDALEELPDEPQVCPEQAAAETITRVYDPPSGNLPPVYFENGKPVMPLNYQGQLAMILRSLEGKSNARLRFIGYTSNERLDRRTMLIYEDDIGLSAARARRVKELVMKEMSLTEEQVEHEGRGNVQSADVVNMGFSQSEPSHVIVEAVYDDLATMDEEEGLEITRFNRVVKLKDPYSLNLMRITVDGKPLHDPNKSTQDMQRCTDAALEDANVQLRFDGLEIKPRLNVNAWPNTIRYNDLRETEHYEDQVRFKIYSNYPSYIDKSEVRIFDQEKSTRDTPLAIVEVDKTGNAYWRANFETYDAPGRDLKYLLRVYDKEGNFDETETQSLWVVDIQQPGLRDRDADKELLMGFGNNRLALENMPKKGGTVRVNGSEIPAGHKVWVAGRSTPVSEDGKFIFEEIIPPGLHTMEVAVLDEAGGGELFLRDLKLDTSEWFYVGIADVTASKDNTNGPAQLVTGDTTHYDDDLTIDGRIAYYIKGKFWSDWELTSSMDTREAPIDEMFSNFINKSPDSLFRRMDPDYYYPSYGDDGTVEEGAPTQGKFYLKINKYANHILWGNFNSSYLENDLAHIERGLYGLNLHYETESSTSFGEKIFSFDGFLADPGTVASRDEFRGTGGSVYFLRHQDILMGSDRIRIEIRDKDSGMVVGVKNLASALDYDVDYLQGRIMLTEPLSAVVNDSMLINSDGSSGDHAYLVVNYEYTPGFSEIDTVITGGQVHAWFADTLKVGVTGSTTDDDITQTSLTGVNVTLRKDAGTWIKVQSATSEGAGTDTLISNDGGFGFNTVTQPTGANINAGATRVDASLQLKEVLQHIEGMEEVSGTITLYSQELEPGYSAPGLVALNKTTQSGGTVSVIPIENLDVKLKADSKKQEQGLTTSANELNVGYKVDENWKASFGYRLDKRTDNSPTVLLTQKEGKRSDLLLQADYDSKENWNSYMFYQGTLDTTGNREENSRTGFGGGYRTSDRFKLTGELSGGDLGTTAQLGTEYLYTDSTTLYANYSIDNERTD